MVTDASDLYLQQKRALRIVANFHRLPCYFINTDTLSRSLKLSKLPDLAHYFTCILGFRIFHGTSPDFICASFDEAEHRFCLRDRFNLHTSKKHLESLICNNFQQSSTRIVFFVYYRIQHCIYFELAQYGVLYKPKTKINTYRLA